MQLNLRKVFKMTQLVDEGSSHNVINITVEGKSVFSTEMSLYCENYKACDYALKLSKVFPGQVVKIQAMARIKAMYRDGELLGPIRTMESFYSNLTPEETESTKVLVGPGEWI